jgi:xanthine dehydrogenase YagT iron-sulfur-binding subunit
MADNVTKPDERAGLSRRTFLKGISGAGLGAVALPATGLLGADLDSATTTTAQQEPAPGVIKGTVPIQLKVNGASHELKVEPRTTLLDALRNQLDLTGSKQVCDRGTCGACTVLMDGKPVTACMVLAIDAQGAEIQTIEGLADGDHLDPVQQAFIECDALQCGFCTPGMIMSTKATLAAHPQPTLEQIQEGLAGNICRCGTYNRIFEAAAKAAGGAKG